MKFILLLVFLCVVFFATTLYLWRGIRTKRFSRSKILILFSFQLILVGLTGVIFHKRIEKLLILLNDYSPFQIGVSGHCSCNFVKQLDKDNYAIHRSFARKVTGNRFIKNNSMLHKFIHQNHLVDVVDNDGYRIAHLTHSSAHLTQHAYDRLKEMGIRFKTALKLLAKSDAYFVVSSLSRTEHTQQEELRKIAMNATSGISSHSYGVSFDIEKIKTPDRCLDVQMCLKQVLRDMQDEGKILLCPESNCIHVTVIN
jgi:hypothetical protein